MSAVPNTVRASIRLSPTVHPRLRFIISILIINTCLDYRPIICDLCPSLVALCQECKYIKTFASVTLPRRQWKQDDLVNYI